MSDKPAGIVKASLEEQISLVLSQYPDINNVYSLFRNTDNIYHIFHQEKSSTHKNKPLLFRVENEGAGNYIGVYEFIGGINPMSYRRFLETEWQQSPFERENNIVVDILTGKKFDSVSQLATKSVSLGDQLIVKPISGERAKAEVGSIVTLSGVVILNNRIRGFEEYAKKVRATEI